MHADAHDEVNEWLRSAEVRRRLRLTTCQLAHLRTSGEIGFRKSGNAYLYSVLDCERIATGAKRPRQVH